MEIERRVEELEQRVNYLIEILGSLSEDLEEVLKKLKSMGEFSTVFGTTQTARTKMAQQTISFEETPNVSISQQGEENLKDVRKVFPKDLDEMLYFETTEEHVLIKPRQYLGSDNFRKIAAIIRDQLGGEYISAGKDSHFRVSKRI